MRTIKIPLLENIDTNSVSYKQSLTKMMIAAEIDEAIKKRGLKKQEFAAKVNSNASEVTKWLSGCHNFTVDKLIEIGDCLGIDLVFKLPTIKNYCRPCEFKIVAAACV